MTCRWACLDVAYVMAQGEMVRLVCRWGAARPLADVAAVLGGAHHSRRPTAGATGARLRLQSALLGSMVAMLCCVSPLQPWCTKSK